MSEDDANVADELESKLGEEQGGLKFVGPGENPPASGAYLTVPSDQLDVARRYLEENGETDHPLVAAFVNAGEPKSYETETTDSTDYVGVDREYMTHADDRQRPYAADGGVQQVVEDKLLADENFGYMGDQPSQPSNQIVGSGSSQQHIVPGTSGAGVSGLRVDAEEEGEPAGAPSTEAGKSEAPKVRAHKVPAKGTDKEASAGTTA